MRRSTQPLSDRGNTSGPAGTEDAVGEQTAGARARGGVIAQTAPGGLAGTNEVVAGANTPTVQAPPASGSLPASGVGPAVEQSGRTPGEAEGETRSPRGSTTTPSGQQALESQRSTVASSRQLPFTGVELPLVALLGMTALAAGVVLRRRPAAR